MKQLTNKQRKAIYTKAASHFLIGNDFGVCCYLQELLSDKFNVHIHTRDIGIYFPEFALFNPYHGYLFWWKMKDSSSRVNALLLSAAMCD